MSNEFVVGAFVAAMAVIVAWNLWQGRKGARKPAEAGAGTAGAAAVAGQAGGDAGGGACGPSGSDGACGGGDGA